MKHTITHNLASELGLLASLVAEVRYTDSINEFKDLMGQINTLSREIYAQAAIFTIKEECEELKKDLNDIYDKID